MPTITKTVEFYSLPRIERMNTSDSLKLSLNVAGSCDSLHWYMNLFTARM